MRVCDGLQEAKVSLQLQSFQQRLDHLQSVRDDYAARLELKSREYDTLMTQHQREQLDYQNRLERERSAREQADKMAQALSVRT